jgi:hypothetical protein
MKYLRTINELLAMTDYNLPKFERSRDISEEEFLDIFHTHCQNFSLDNDPLYRLKSKRGDLQLFTPMPRSFTRISKKRNTYSTNINNEITYII